MSEAKKTAIAAKALMEVASQLLAIHDEMMEGHVEQPDEAIPVFPKKAQQKLEAGICLRCGLDRKESPQPFRRGLCQRCAAFVGRRLRENPMGETVLISEGLMAPKHYKPDGSIDPVDEALTRAADTIRQRIAKSREGNARPSRTKKKQ